MSMYFYTTVYAYSKNLDELKNITNEKLEEIVESRFHPGEEPWVRKKRAGKIEGLFSSCLLIEADGNYGTLLCSKNLSQYFPNILFLEINSVECDDPDIHMILNNQIVPISLDRFKLMDCTFLQKATFDIMIEIYNQIDVAFLEEYEVFLLDKQFEW